MRPDEGGRDLTLGVQVSSVVMKHALMFGHMDASIFHLARAVDFDQAHTTGRYVGSAEDRKDGFLHFSTASQIRESAARHRSGEAGLVLIEVDAAVLGDALRWETSRGGQKFPHLYGPLPLSAVQCAMPLAVGEDGHHQFPEWL